MKRTLHVYILFLFISAIVIAACSGTPESRIVGTWKVEKVETDSDTNAVKPEVMEKVIDVYKSVYFDFLDDNTVKIVSAGEIHDGTWEFRDDDQSVYIKIEGSSIKEPNKLGELKDGKLVSVNKTGIGTITIIYVKE